MKNLKYIKTFESFKVNEEMILPGPGALGALGALYAPFLPFLIAIQSTKAVYDRVKFRKAKRFLGDFFEKIANDSVLKNISDGLVTGSIYPKPTDAVLNQEIRKIEIQKALDRIKEISEEGDYEKFIGYMSYMNNNNEDWKKHLQYWPIFLKDPSPIGFNKQKTEFLDADDTIDDIQDIVKKIASSF